MEGKWLSILEFANYKSKSISTVRRYIKANRVKYREDNGKYLIWVKNFIQDDDSNTKESLDLKLEIERLKKENIDLKNEIAEAKMLIELYENGNFGLSKKNLPELPAQL